MTCLRGASAVQRLLEQHAAIPLRVLVVWEPVIFSDIAPPTNFALSRITDTRAAQFWDHDLALSRAMGGRDDEILWDFVALYTAAARWEGAPPEPVVSGGPVVHAIEEVGSALTAMAAGGS